MRITGYNSVRSRRHASAITMIEMMVVVAVAAIIASFLLATLAGPMTR